jgi:hypothetical protein
MKITEATDQCPWCNAQVPAGAGYVADDVPASQQPASLFSAPASPAGRAKPTYRERRHTWIWLGNFATILVGVIISALKLGGKGGLVGGIAMIALALLSLAVSRFGTRWDDTTFWTKAMIVPGAIACIAVILLALAWLIGEGGGDGLDFGGDGGSRSKRATVRRKKKAADEDTLEASSAVNSSQ